MICKKCGKCYDNTWKICLICREQLIEDSSAQDVVIPKSDKTSSGIANPQYYLNQFKKFDKNGGRFCLTWNWSAALFYWVWQLCRNLWAKCLIYTIVYTGLGYFVPYLLILHFGPKVAIISPIVIWVTGFIFYGCVGNYDYYLKKTRNENLWPFLSYRKFKWLFWVLVLLFVVSWGAFVVQSMKSMGAIIQNMSNPVSATGETYEVDGIKYTPTKGWQILGQLPQTMPGIRMKNEKIFLVKDVDEKGALRSNLFGQVTLFIGWPKKGEKFVSYDQEEVKKMVEITSVAQKNPMFKFMRIENVVSKPQSIEINGKTWIRTYQTLGFNGQDGGLASITYCTVGANRLVMLGFSGAASEKDLASEQIERFAASFKFGETKPQ